MKEKLKIYKSKATSFWNERSKKQKGLLIGTVAAFILLVSIASIFATSSNMVPLYRDLSLQEVGQVKEELDARGIAYELDSGGTTVHVPEAQAESLIVDLAAAGIPDSGNIDYGFFSDNVSWGMTDNEFEVIKVDAMQSELASLMTGIAGIDGADVMINVPEEEVFVSDSNQTASASIVLNVKPGHDIQNDQVETLYNLASKSVPNLSNDDIVIMDQNFNYFDINNSENANSSDAYTYQQGVKEDIERDIQQRLQKMLGTMVGQDKVVASVTADIDFTQENRTEDLVEPVDEETMEGLPVSVERIEEAYEGGTPVGGTAGTGDEDVPGYEAEDGEGGGDYEMSKETVNNEFNRIQRNIQESPFKVRDLGIQVAVDSTKGENEQGEVEMLSQQEQNTVEESIQSMVDSMITTSIDGSYDQEIDTADKASIVFQEFEGSPQITPPSEGIPVWVYLAGGILLLLIFFLVWRLLKRRNEEEEEMVFEEVIEEKPKAVPDIEEKENDSTVKRKQLERMAKEKPEDFAKLLRSWIAED
ncbi:flagellar M-ring protein [Halobacillus andaensis]|uniref:Flagellar M-ring protein n=1 Tax=Halobacillus andaensis TaxID=1176239 RepID=A0A917AZG0_HALAA|nr:flagellar basal-body MS-ring/collar protein FliF [Halobacillus andaensis]MBP2003497.1 flagellar M-ring protein FliF [Halobacillus andaensis]GGF11069.1 flagellar M-ring protein [Halobacillus andaensis]